VSAAAHRITNLLDGQSRESSGARNGSGVDSKTIRR
jgi:hypothetical protein